MPDCNRRTKPRRMKAMTSYGAAEKHDGRISGLVQRDQRSGPGIDRDVTSELGEPSCLKVDLVKEFESRGVHFNSRVLIDQVYPDDEAPLLVLANE